MLVCVKHIMVVHKQFWHKLNYFFFLNFWKNIYIICAEISIIIIKLNSEVFDCPSLNLKHAKSLDFCQTLRLSHKDNNVIFISLYKHYVSKISELKNQLPKLRFEILLIIQQFVAESIQVLQVLRYPTFGKTKFTCIFIFYIFIEPLLHFFKIDIFLVNKLVLVQMIFHCGLEG
jgi:hypothetical protein